MTTKIMTGSGALILIKLTGLWAEHTVALLPSNYYVDLGYEWQHKNDECNFKKAMKGSGKASFILFS